MQKRFDNCWAVLRATPRHHGNIKRLRGEFAHLLRFRVGDWRVVYRIDERARTVIVLKIAHRCEIYE